MLSPTLRGGVMSHRPGFLDLFRIVLGVFLTYKGLYFITHMPELEMTTAGINMYFAGATLAHYVVFAHILGGPLIAFGLFTRIICCIQLPILIGAIFMVDYPGGFSLDRSSPQPVDCHRGTCGSADLYGLRRRALFARCQTS